MKLCCTIQTVFKTLIFIISKQLHLCPLIIAQDQRYIQSRIPTYYIFLYSTIKAYLKFTPNFSFVRSLLIFCMCLCMSVQFEE